MRDGVVERDVEVTVLEAHDPVRFGVPGFFCAAAVVALLDVEARILSRSSFFALSFSKKMRFKCKVCNSTNF